MPGEDTVELHQLRIFVMVAEEHNLTRGAQRLYMTPPTVSAHIKALEDELGVQLFVRTSRGMALTEQGKLLKARAEHTLQAAHALVQQAAALQTQVVGHARCGLNTSPGFLRIGRVVQYLQEAYPQLTLAFLASSSGNIVEGLVQGSMEGGYIFGASPSALLTTHYLDLAEVVIAAPRQWAARLAMADWQDLAQLPWISSEGYCPFETLAETLFQQRCLPYKRLVVSSDDGTKAELVAAGVGVALLERSEVVHGAQAERMTIWRTAPMQCALHFAYATQRQHEPLIVALRRAVLQAWEAPRPATITS